MEENPKLFQFDPRYIFNSIRAYGLIGGVYVKRILIGD